MHAAASAPREPCWAAGTMAGGGGAAAGTRAGAVHTGAGVARSSLETYSTLVVTSVPM